VSDKSACLCRSMRARVRRANNSKG
jgi:hypothetical protein